MKGFAMKGLLTVALCWSLLFTACQNEDSAGDESDTAMEQVQAPSVDASGGADTNAGGNGSGNAANADEEASGGDNADTSVDGSGTNADANGGSGDSGDSGTVGDDSGSDADNAGNPTAGSGNDVGANDSDNNADGSGDNADAGTSNTDNSSSDAGVGSDSGTSGNETNAGGNNVNGDSGSNANGSDDNASVGSSGGTDNNGSSASGSGDANTSETDADVGNTTGTSSGSNSNGSGATGSGTTGSSDTSRDDIEDSASGSGGSDSETNPTMSGGRLVQRDVTTWNGVTVGDVILRDGSRVSAASLADGINSDNPPVAVVAYFVDGGYVAVGMPSEELAWTASDNADATKKFTAVASNKIPTDDGYDFTGVVDGSTSWQKLRDCDATGIEDVALHYPAFFYAKNYASENRISGDWYVPSIAELYEVYVNHDCINSSLKAIGQTELTKMYWSSSLYETKQHETNSAWYLNFKTLKKPYYTVAYESKTKSHSVLPIRVFTDDSSAQ